MGASRGPARAPVAVTDHDELPPPPRTSPAPDEEAERWPEQSSSDYVPDVPSEPEVEELPETD